MPATLEEEKLKALRTYLPRSLVAVHAGPGRTASGTLVAIGSDVLVATAGHVVRGLAIPNWSELGLLSEPIVGTPDDPHFTSWPGSVAAAVASPSPPLYPDVGALLLTPEAARCLRERALGLDALDDPGHRQLLDEHQELGGFPLNQRSRFVIA